MRIKTIELEINDVKREMTIKSLKVKQLKNIIQDLSECILNIFTIFKTVATDEEFLNKIIEPILKSLDLILINISKMSNISVEDLEELDIEDIVNILKAILEVNGIKIEKIKKFTQSFLRVHQKEEDKELKEMFKGKEI